MLVKKSMLVKNFGYVGEKISHVGERYVGEDRNLHVCWWSMLANNFFMLVKTKPVRWGKFFLTNIQNLFANMLHQHTWRFLSSPTCEFFSPTYPIFLSNILFFTKIYHQHHFTHTNSDLRNLTLNLSAWAYHSVIITVRFHALKGRFEGVLWV